MKTNTAAARPTTCLRSTAAAVALSAALLTAAHADRDRRMPEAVPADYRSECGACHLAYPPGLLPAASWRALIGSLERHFGSDASLDAAALGRIGTWLETHAATGGRAEVPPPDARITATHWFARKHRRIDASVWRQPNVRSPANCAACHAGAERGDFDDNGARVPDVPGAGAHRGLRRD